MSAKDCIKGQAYTVHVLATFKRFSSHQISHQWFIMI